MPFKVYNIRDAYNAEVAKYGTEKKAYENFIQNLSSHTFANWGMYPGKPYVFQYFEKTKKLYDTNPHIISLGPTKANNEVYYGINLHYIPIQMRLQIVELVYNAFGNTVYGEIEKHPLPQDAKKQTQIGQCVMGNMKNLANRFNIMTAIHKYDIGLVKNCVELNYNEIHLMCLSNENTFNNGTIVDAQKEFLKNFKVI